MHRMSVGDKQMEKNEAGNKVGNDGREELLLYVREGISTRVAFIEQMIFGQRPERC